MWSVWSERSSSRGSDRRSWGVGGWLRCSVPETQLDAAESCFGGGGVGDQVLLFPQVSKES